MYYLIIFTELERVNKEKEKVVKAQRELKEENGKLHATFAQLESEYDRNKEELSRRLQQQQEETGAAITRLLHTETHILNLW